MATREVAAAPTAGPRSTATARAMVKSKRRAPPGVLVAGCGAGRARDELLAVLQRAFERLGEVAVGDADANANRVEASLLEDVNGAHPGQLGPGGLAGLVGPLGTTGGLV